MQICTPRNKLLDISKVGSDWYSFANPYSSFKKWHFRLFFFSLQIRRESQARTIWECHMGESELHFFSCRKSAISFPIGKNDYSTDHCFLLTILKMPNVVAHLVKKTLLILSFLVVEKPHFPHPPKKRTNFSDGHYYSSARRRHLSCCLGWERVSLQINQVGMPPVLLTFVARSRREAAFIISTIIEDGTGGKTLSVSWLPRI